MTTLKLFVIDFLILHFHDKIMNNHWLHLCFKAALSAGEAILEVYETSFSVFTKDDDSPVTKADIAASNIIKDILRETGLPFISEEDISYSHEERKAFPCYWLIDPLDGTKEFVKRNGEFTVNIAFMQDDRPVAGVIYAPVSDTLWLNYSENDVAKIENALSYKDVDFNILDFSSFKLCADERQRPFTVLVSRSHRTEEVDAFINRHIKSCHHDMVIDSCGSSLKFARLAEHTADCYVCYSKTKEWDTAAAEAILSASGGKVVDISTGKTLLYNKMSWQNPPFIATAKNVEIQIVENLLNS